MAKRSISNVSLGCWPCTVLCSMLDILTRFPSGLLFFHFTFSLGHFPFRLCCLLCGRHFGCWLRRCNAVASILFVHFSSSCPQVLRSTFTSCAVQFRFVSPAPLLFAFVCALCRLRLSSPPILSKLFALPVGSAHVPRWPGKMNSGEVLPCQQSKSSSRHQQWHWQICSALLAHVRYWLAFCLLDACPTFPLLCLRFALI